MTEQRWSAVRYSGALDNLPRPVSWSARSLVETMTRHRDWIGEKVEAPAWSPVRMKPDTARRLAANVEAVTMLVLDCDSGESLDTLEALGDEYVRMGHTSWSHRPEHPKVRLVFPFRPDVPCPVSVWPRVWGAAARWAAAHGVTVDAATKDPSRLYFLPATAPELEPREWFESWHYGEQEPQRVGGLPSRPRSFLSWASLASAYPEPETVRMAPPKSTAGRLGETEDRRERRRRAFARGMLKHRCRAMVAAGEGGKGAKTGRAARTFALGRLVARLTRAGLIDEGWGVATVEDAAVASGLPAKEYGRAIRNGLAAGASDPLEDIDSMLTED